MYQDEYTREKSFIISQIVTERKRKGWTQDDLATEANISRHSVTNMESEKPVSADTILKAAFALDLTLVPRSHIFPNAADLATKVIAPFFTTMSIDDKRQFVKSLHENM